MNVNGGTDHQSIGEVLATLRDEFPDITISKIRFLEAQGLIDPERTPSGYRKFRDGDVARLAWVLHQQKQNFLPLKVIKARLDAARPGELPDDVELAPGEGGGAGEDTGSEDQPRATSRARATKPTTKPVTKPATKPTSKSVSATGPKPKRAPKVTRASASARAHEPAGSKRAAAPSMFESPMLPLDDGTDDELVLEGSGASLTRSELATAAGLTDAALAELEEYGMIAPAAGSGDRVIFDEDALVIATLAAGFSGHGIGPRHLRMFRVAAEREAGLYDQVIAPRLKRRNPEARAQAREDLVDLARLGRAMRAAFLRGATSGLLRD